MPSFLIPILTIVGIVVVAIVFLVILIKSCWKVAGTNEVLIVSGLGKVKCKTGGGIFVFPLIQKVQHMTLENIQVDFTSRDEIPTKDAIHILVDAVANMAISKEPKLQAIAASKFAGYSIQQIRETVIPILEGNIREIISQTQFEDLIRGDKKEFAEKVLDNVKPNLADLGLDLTTFNIQNFNDRNGVIKDLGVDNIEKVRKDAKIAAAKAKSEVEIATAQAEKAANDEKVKAATEIAKKENAFKIQCAELQREADIKQAEADAAKAIEAENQRKTREIATADANLAKQEKEIELKERAVVVKERELEAEVKKTAEANKYAEQQAADAKLYKIQKESEAELFERERKAEAEKIEAEKRADAEKALAEAVKAKGLAEAEAARAKGEAEAAAVKAKLEAEAEGLKQKAEAMSLYNDAAKQQQLLDTVKVYFEQLPAVAEAAGKAYTNVDKIYMYGDGGSKLTGNILNNVTQISEGLGESLGIDVKALMNSFIGNLAANKVQGKKEEKSE